MQNFTRAFIFSLFFLYFSYIQASIIYVKHNAAGANNGSSWSNAFTKIQDAIDAASYSGDEIWVAAGTYLPTKNKSGSVPVDAREKTFRIYKSIAIYGGFSGTESLLSERNYKTNVTILSGILGIVQAYQVVYISSLTVATLDGFTITGGKATGGGAYANGGGIYLSNASSVILQNLKIQQNEAVKGGGLSNENSSAVTIENVVFRENTAEKGGALYNDNISALTIKGCNFCNNSASENGGALFNKSLSSVLIVNSVLCNNSAEGNGGGVYNHSVSSITVTNSTFYQNSAQGNGGGFYIVSSSGCSFYNSILWNNTDQNGSNANAQAYANGSTSAKNFYYSLMKGSNGSGGGWTSAFTDGGNNLDSDPLFFDPNGTDNTSCTDDDNFGLSAGSPALNAGTNAAPGITASDAEGESRVQDGTVDLGPFEGIGDVGFPVEWTFIEAQWKNSASGRSAEIQWGTAQEINNDYFVVERAIKGSADDRWEEAGMTKGAGTTDKSMVYTFEDRNIQANEGVVFSYRIRQVDIDGKFSYSKSVELVLSGNDQISFAAYPNPVSGSLTIQAAIEGDQLLESVRILSLTGQSVYEANPASTKWENTIDVSHLPEGLYYVQLVHTFGQKSIRLMVK